MYQQDSSESIKQQNPADSTKVMDFDDVVEEQKDY